MDRPSRIGTNQRKSPLGLVGQIVAGIAGLGIVLATFIFAGIFLAGALLLGAAFFVAFRIWRIFNKPDPQARQDFIINTIHKAQQRRGGPGGQAAGSRTARASGTVIDGEAEEVTTSGPRD